MRQTKKQSVANGMNNRLFSVDFHDFLEREAVLNDVEMSTEFGISVWDVQRLRKHIQR
jgi:hypothetical protein